MTFKDKFSSIKWNTNIKQNKQKKRSHCWWHDKSESLFFRLQPSEITCSARVARTPLECGDDGQRPLACSYIHPNQRQSVSHSVQQSFTQTIYTAETEEKASLVGGGGSDRGRGRSLQERGGAQVTAMSLISSRTCNLTGGRMHYWS